MSDSVAFRIAIFDLVDGQPFFGDYQFLRGNHLRNPPHEPISSENDLFLPTNSVFLNNIKNEAIEHDRCAEDAFLNLQTMDSAVMEDRISNYNRHALPTESFERLSPASVLKEQQAYSQHANQGLVECSW